MIRHVFFAVIIVVVLGTGANSAETENSNPPTENAAHENKATVLEIAPFNDLSRRLRALQLVQDRMATGNAKAVDAQRALLEQILSSLETLSGLAGLTEADTHELLPLALLNGADPERIRAVLGQSGLTSRDPFLLGSLAYSEGRVQEAVAAFETVDEAKLSPIARAQFYLTKGVLFTDLEPQKATQNFRKARLGAPGTLIEESALRREAILQIAEPALFLPLVRSYLFRFANSPFASAFISQFAFSIGALVPEAQIRITTELDDLLANAKDQDKQNFYSILARSSLIGGNRTLTEFATDRAIREVTNPSQLLSARLYRAAFSIAGDAHIEAASELHSLMRVPLQTFDREILSAAISVAKELRRWPYQDEKPKNIGGADKLFAAPAIADEETNSIAVTHAHKLLSETDELMGVKP
jgi:chemotaxis protein MotC